MRKFNELLCVAVLIAFVAFLMQGTAVSSKTAKEVFDSLKQSIDVSELSKCDKAKFKKETGFAQNEFDSVVYYASDSVMEVREVMLVKLKDSSQAQELKEKLESRVAQKQELFKGYAPEQSALLENYVLEERAGFVFFAVCSEPELAVDTFRKSL